MSGVKSRGVAWAFASERAMSRDRPHSTGAEKMASEAEAARFLFLVAKRAYRVATPHMKVRVNSHYPAPHVGFCICPGSVPWAFLAWIQRVRDPSPSVSASHKRHIAMYPQHLATALHESVGASRALRAQRAAWGRRAARESASPLALHERGARSAPPGVGGRRTKAEIRWRFTSAARAAHRLG